MRETGRTHGTGVTRSEFFRGAAVVSRLPLPGILLAAAALLAFSLLFMAPAAQAANAPGQATSLKTASAAPRAGAFRMPGKSGGTRSIAQAKLRAAFDSAEKKIPALRADKVKSRWRQPWEDLRDTFLSVYQSRPDGNLAPRALFRAGDCQLALAEASRRADEFRQAIAIYEAVANEYPKSDQAAPALHAALTVASERGDSQRAGGFARRLEKSYPKSREALQARSRAGAAKAAPAKKAGPVELETLSWNTISKDQVEIVLDFSGPARVDAKLLRPRGGQPCVDLNIHDAGVVSEIRRGLSMKTGLLRKVRVRTEPGGGTHVCLDFTQVAHFSTSRERDAARVLVRVDTLKERRPGKAPGAVAGKSAKGGQAASLTPAAATGVTGPEPRTVTIDAGHGGRDPGTFHNNILERSVTLDVALRLGKILRDNGMRVVYTRTKNVTVPLAERTRLAGEKRSDLFVSIHVNANRQPSIRGFETYYLDAAGRDALLASAARGSGGAKGAKAVKAPVRKAALSGRLLESQRLARDIQRKATRRVGAKGMPIVDNGVKSGPFYVLGTAAMPAVLTEIGYCTNPRDAQMLARPAYRQAVAEGIAEGILAYRDRARARVTADGGALGKARAAR